MDVDELLSQRGAEWRAGQPPPAAPDLALVTAARHPGRPRRRALVLAAAVVVVVVVGMVVARSRHTTSRVVTTPAPDATTSTTAAPSAELQAALAAWAGYPVDASPRPLVLLEGDVNAPASGFTTTAMKEAFLSGAFVDQDSSKVVAARFSTPYPLIGTSEALAALRAQGSPGPDPHPIPLVITAIDPGSGSFLTDRGRVDLPAWEFTFRGVTDPAEVLAVAPSARFPLPAGVGRATMGAKGAPTDRTITLTVAGAPAGGGPCTTDYTVDVAESHAAVALEVHEHRHQGATSGSGPGQGLDTCSLVAIPRTVTVHLPSPVGDRVLVDASTKAPVPFAP